MCVVVMRMRGLDVVCVVNTQVYRRVSFITFLQPSKHGMIVQDFGVNVLKCGLYTMNEPGQLPWLLIKRPFFELE
jgi:hypothetical protein